MIALNRASEKTSTETAARLIDAVRSVAAELHPSRRETRVSLDSSLDRDLGFDSLGRSELIARLEGTFDVTLPDTVLVAAESPRDLLRAVLVARGREKSLSEAADVAAIHLGSAEVVPHTAATLNEVLNWHAGKHPDRPHIRFYADEGDGEVITYRQLQQDSRRLAAGLQAMDVGPGSAIAIMLPTSRDYFVAFFGALSAGCIPVPIYPPARPNRIGEHIRRHMGILNNCRARMLIGSPEAKPVTRLLRSHVETLDSAVTVDELYALSGTAFNGPLVSADDIAFLQYTSGSTGNPKGVTLTHANLLSNIRAMATVLAATPDDTFVSWLPLYHDMGLIGAWLGSLHQATPLVIMSPLSFLARPSRWLKAIHRYRGTISGGPNFAYELCLRRLGSEDLKGLDLSSWRVAFNGAEPVSPDTVENFCAHFANNGFRRQAMVPVYGLAESCVGLAFPPLERGPLIDRILRDPLAASGRAIPAPPDDEKALGFVACGQPLPKHQIRVVDPAGRELPERCEGRLQFRGPSSTSGYYRDPDATRRLFDGEWLESGDLAYIAKGEVFVTGRIKDLVIRAGRNIHPADLEEAIGAIDGFLPGRVAVFGSTDPESGTERLVIIAETRKREQTELERLRAEVNEATSDLIGAPADEVVLAPPNTVPHTSSGKIRRAACRELWEAGLVGRGHRPPWLQMTRLAIAGAIPRLRRIGRTVRASLFAVYAWVAATIIAPVAWLAAMIMPRFSWRWSALRGCARLLALVTGTRISAKGLDNLPSADRPCIIISNHASYLDGFVLIAVLPRPVGFVAKAELADSWFTRLPLARIGTRFVERFDRQKGIEDFHAVTEASRAGHPPLFFPEGTFGRMPGLLPFHLGAFSAAVETGYPVVPIAIRGTRSILRSGSWFPNRGSVSVTIGKPIFPDNGKDTWTATVWLRDLARETVLRHCGEPDLKHEPFLTMPRGADE